MLREGDLIPNVDVELVDGRRIKLSDLKGKIVVVYFYPKAFTPGCTREAEAFNELYDEFKKLGAEVIGVSMDPKDRNAKFREKLGLRFPVASDMGGGACSAFGVLRGVGPIRYVDRVTFIVGRDGRIRKVIKGFWKSREHAVKALEEVRRLTSE
ncbi:MAG: peroxiredoxin [Desulfurococcales archaeon]|nr:peroxiredoxin [Desulfurococcales archaeon]